MLIKYLGFNKGLICNINGLDFNFKNTCKSESYLDVHLTKGKHTLKIRRKTFYDSILCYLNILNPVFYIWQILFLEHREETLKNDFSIFQVDFEILLQNEAFIILSINDIDRYSGLKIISKKSSNSLHKKRFKIIVISSSILFMSVLNFLNVINHLQLKCDLIVTIVFAVLITFFSIKNILKVIRL